MSTLSICVIAKNEEKFLEQSLGSIKPIADEIIFVDTGSTDNTVHIAKQFTKNIHYFKWIDDFSAAYNFSTNLANCDYVFRWDADFYLPETSIKTLLDAKKNDFKNYNLINFYWKDIDTSNGKIIGESKRDFIYKRGEYFSYLPIHSYLKPVNPQATQRLHLPRVYIEHHKDQIEKNQRYSQSLLMIKKAINDGYNIPYLNFHYILALMYTHDYRTALTQIDKFLDLWPDYTPNKIIILLEKKLACLIQLNLYELIDIGTMVEYYETKFEGNKQFLLYSADVWALFDKNEAVLRYKQYLDDPLQPNELDGPFIYERYIKHPKKMINELSSQDS